MKKLIRCSKLYYTNDSKVESIAFWVLWSVGIISTFKSGYYMDILRYSTCTFVIALALWAYLIKGKKAKIEIEESKLLNDYNENEERADKKYCDKYIKLIGTVSHIEFDEYKDIFIEMASDDKYCVGASAILANKKCIKYVESIHVGDKMIFYGNFLRDDSRLCLDVKYLKLENGGA
ncbi:OB-fold putative lipoprotein [Terrisporobacter hibernicus]|uniref:OB-fold putative lipoprotein n=1 Tax=Terrisporobacter hibernicus TaxID=2813371 RepID=A0AAX2ZEF2_9FIRM|nr:OB-fold putative lipoprotein [Terrisporobacter hibernicus]UEL47723.1 OB-fold putative lipoprotein [Terrisporobacter hibernicus]